MRKTARSTVLRTVALALLSCAVLSSTPQAFARMSKLDGDVVSTRKGEGYKYVRVYKKSKKEPNPVKGVYTRKASPGKTRNLWNKGPIGSSIKSGKGSKVLKQKLCRQEQFQPDPCSVYVLNP
ncbi:hypothetical protein ABZY93_21020 [Streptomyces smyrnaeus]|uniref:hypothetical protein n=1 Tax=Streptomyces smyrnaeus TaxID=1387713 RepID=UPI0033B649CB